MSKKWVVRDVKPNEKLQNKDTGMIKESSWAVERILIE